jgi:hypothetical protein
VSELTTLQSAATSHADKVSTFDVVLVLVAVVLMFALLAVLAELWFEREAQRHRVEALRERLEDDLRRERGQ